MPNHFHLVVETPQGNLVAGRQWFLSPYTSRFNRIRPAKPAMRVKLGMAKSEGETQMSPVE